MLDGAVTNTATSITVADGSSYPSPSVSAPMVIVIGPETASEEQILISARSGNVLTVAASGRNWHLGGSGTGVAHGNGEVIRHVLDADTVDDVNAHVNDDTRDDHSQYLNTSRHASTGHTSAMLTDLTVATADIAAGAVTTAKLADGAVTLAKLGAVPACRAYRSVAQLIAHATTQAVVFDLERYDNDTMHSGGTERITFTTAGVYIVTLNCQMVSAADYVGIVVSIRLNGTTVIASQNITQNVAGGGGPGISVATTYKFSAADYIEALIYQANSAAAARDLNANGNYSPEFAAAWLGAG
jgi:hypothetical protein